jgi:hypothetical protein
MQSCMGMQNVCLVFGESKHFRIHGKIKQFEKKIAKHKFNVNALSNSIFCPLSVHVLQLLCLTSFYELHLFEFSVLLLE